MQTILVCDDDKQIVEAIDIYLTGEGFKVIKTGISGDPVRRSFDLRCNDAGTGWHPHYFKGT